MDNNIGIKEPQGIVLIVISAISDSLFQEQTKCWIQAFPTAAKKSSDRKLASLIKP